MTTTIIIGLLIPLLGTMLGSAFVFMMKDENIGAQKLLILLVRDCSQVTRTYLSNHYSI